jgi:hypothetical protein
MLDEKARHSCPRQEFGIIIYVPTFTQDPANAPACLPTCAVFDCLANVGYDREELVTGDTICGLNGCLETCCHKSMWSRYYTCLACFAAAYGNA